MTSPRATRPELVLPPTRHLGTSIAAGLAAAVVFAFGIALLVDPKVDADMRPGIIALGLLFGGTLAILAVALARGHGAMWLDTTQDRLGFGITGLGDIWWLPRSRIAGLRMIAMPTPGATIERWMLLIAVNEETPNASTSTTNLHIVLAESDARAFLDGIGSRLASHLGLPYGEGRDDLDLPAATRHEAHYAVKRGAALQLVLTAFGTSLVAFGILALGQLENEPIVGFIFAPILIVMGTALAAVALVKRFATESLRSDGQTFTHGFAFGRFRWGERTIRAPHPRFRLRLLGMRGAMLEVLGDDGTLVTAAGATSRSKLSLEEVSRLSTKFTAPTPGEPAATP